MLALAGCAGRAGPPPLSNADRQCLAELTRLGVDYRPIALPADTKRACRVENPVRVTAATVPFNQPALASCAFVLRFDEFERAVLRPLARSYFAQDLTGVVHFGAYSCRTTREGRESEHAKGIAIDVAGFELANGATISVKSDWYRRGKTRDFLHAVARSACRYFNEVLDPDSDADHRDHIHLDLGPYRLCVRR